MSSGPTLMGSNAVESTKESWVNIEIFKEMYCSYSGECPLHRVIQNDNICLWCKYRQPIDMPQIIKGRIERNG